MLVSEKYFDYSGTDLALCDRAAQAAASQAASTAAGVAAQQGSNANAGEAALTPFYTSEMKAQHGFTPGQTSEMETAILGGAGAGTGAADESAKLEAARTRNASGFTKALDESARDRAKAGATGSEAVAAQDVMAAKAENQAGASGMAGLTGEELGDQEKAMGVQSQDIDDEIKAGQSGWFQNLTSGVNAGANAFKALYPGGVPSI